MWINLWISPVIEIFDLLLGPEYYTGDKYYTTPAACVSCLVTPEGATATEG
jgi:hypothetical protein